MTFSNLEDAKPATGTSDAPPADPEGKAAELLDGGGRSGQGHGGKRKGAGRKPGAATGKRRGAAGTPAGGESSDGSVAPPPITEEEIKAMAILGNTVWVLIGKATGLKPLEPEEQHTLGSVMVPVFRKYASILGGWEAEVAFVIVLGGLVATHLPDPPPRRVVPDEKSYAVEVKPGETRGR